MFLEWDQPGQVDLFDRDYNGSAIVSDVKSRWLISYGFIVCCMPLAQKKDS